MQAISEPNSDVEEGSQGTPVFKDAEETFAGQSPSRDAAAGANAAQDTQDGFASTPNAARSSSSTATPSEAVSSSPEMASKQITDTPETPVVGTASAKTSPTASPATSAKVSSLRQRFEKRNSDKPQLPSSGSSSLIPASSSPKKGSEKRPGPLLIKDNNIIPEGTDELVQAQEKAATDAVIASESTPRAHMSASLGAPSMTEPDSTLANPFAHPSAEEAWEEERVSNPASAATDLGAGSKEAPDTATDGWGQTSATSPIANQFSRISLDASKSAGAGSSSAAAGGKMSIEEELSDAAGAAIPRPSRESKRWSATAAAAAGRAGRRSALILDDKSGKRSSIEGLERLRENFERRRERSGTKLQIADESALPEASNSDEVGSGGDSSERKTAGKSEEDDGEDNIDWGFWGRVMSGELEPTRW